MPAACRPDTQFAAGGCYPKVDYVPRFKDVAPRFNMVYDLNGDGKIALKFSANRYNAPININIVNTLNSVSTISNQRVWLPQSSCATAGNVGCDLNDDLVPQINELGSNPGYNIPAVAANAGTSFLAAPKPVGYQADVPLDNEVVRVERLILQPEQSTRRYTLPKSGILIAGHDGSITLEVQGVSPRKIAMKAGDFEWHTGPETHIITKVGSTRWDAIEAVWK